MLLNEHVINFNENFILTTNSFLIVLRFEVSMIEGEVVVHDNDDDRCKMSCKLVHNLVESQRAREEGLHVREEFACTRESCCMCLRRLHAKGKSSKGSWINAICEETN